MGMNRTALRRALLQVLARLPTPMRQAATPPRILLIRPDHLGDLLFMTPALHRLRMAVPAAHITCLVGPWAAPILANNPDLDEVLTCDFPWFDRRPKTFPWSPYRVLWREAARLRARRCDVAMVQRFDFWWGAALARLAGIPRRIGYNLPDVEPFLTDAVAYAQGLHEVEQNARLVEAAIASLHPPFPSLGSGEGEQGDRGEDLGPLRFTISADDRAWANQRLPDGPLVAIHAGAGAPVKLWDADRWVEVATELRRRLGVVIVLTGGATEVALVQSIGSKLNVPNHIVAGETSLGQLAAVFARCRLVLGPDSGPLHLAAAVGTPTVHLFGPVDPRLFGPWGDPARHVVVQARFFDRPCYNQPCNRLDYAAAELPLHPCMQTITVDDVVRAAQAADESSRLRG